MISELSYDGVDLDKSSNQLSASILTAPVDSRVAHFANLRIFTIEAEGENQAEFE